MQIYCGRYWDRTSDPCRVKSAFLYMISYIPTLLYCADLRQYRFRTHSTPPIHGSWAAFSAVQRAAFPARSPRCSPHCFGPDALSVTNDEHGELREQTPSATQTGAARCSPQRFNISGLHSNSATQPMFDDVSRRLSNYSCPLRCLKNPADCGKAPESNTKPGNQSCQTGPHAEHSERTQIDSLRTLSSPPPRQERPNTSELLALGTLPDFGRSHWLDHARPTSDKRLLQGLNLSDTRKFICRRLHRHTEPWHR